MINEKVERLKADPNAKVIADMDDTQVRLIEAKAELRRAWIRHKPARAERGKLRDKDADKP
jgi:hypothetical protein